MLNLKITPLNAVAAAVLLSTAIRFDVWQNNSEYVTEETNNTVVIHDQFDGTSMKKAKKSFLSLVKKGSKAILIKITSPGGSVMDGRELIGAIQGHPEVKTITFSDNYFMSMGMSTFMEGSVRLITKEAIGLIHRGSSGEHSYGELKDALKEMEEGPQKEELKTKIKLMDILFQREFERLEEFKKVAPKPEVTQAIIDKMKEGHEDLFLTSQELIDSGIATQIVVNSPKEFRS